MTGDFFNSVAGGASILGLILGLVTWAVSRRTDRLIRESALHTQELIAQMHQATQQTLDRIDARAEERHRFER